MVRLWAIASLAAVLVVGIGVAVYVMWAPDKPGGMVSRIVSGSDVPAKPSGAAGSGSDAAAGGSQAESGGQTDATPKPASETGASAVSRAETPKREQPPRQAETSVAVRAEDPEPAEPAPTELQPIDTTPEDDRKSAPIDSVEPAPTAVQLAVTPPDDDRKPAADDPVEPAPTAVQSAVTPPDDDRKPAADDPVETAPTAVQSAVTPPDDDREPAADDPAEPAPTAAQSVDTPPDDDREPAAGDPAEEQVAALPGADEGAETTAAPVEMEEATEPEPAPKGPSLEVLPPSFDIVRIERSGETVIAGRGMPGSEVQVLLNGEIIGRTTSDGRGQWVFLPQSPLVPGNHELSLRSKLSGGEIVESDNIVVVVIPEVQVARSAQETAKAAAPGGASEDPAKAPAKTGPAVPAETAMAAPDAPDTTTAPPAGTVGQASRIVEAVEVAPTVKAEAAGSGSSGAAARPAEQAQEDRAEASAGDQQDPAEILSEKIDVTGQTVDEVTEIATIPAAEATLSRGPATGDSTAGETVPGDAEPTEPVETAASSGDGTAAAGGKDVAQVAAAPPSATTEEPASPARVAAAQGTDEEGTDAPETGNLGAADAPGQSQGPLAILLPRSGQGGAKILQDPGQTGVSDLQLVLRSVDYDAQGNVTISGEAAPGAKVIVYLDNEAIGQGVVGAAGRWRFTPKRPVRSGLHRLRVDQLDDRGDVVARVETPFSRAAILTNLPQEKFVVVQPGNSLWRIARAVYGEGLRYSVIHQSNQRQIRDPDLIYPGQIFMVPQVN